MEEYEVDDRFVRESGHFDLTLIVDAHKIQVSKTVLSIASPVFRVMLESDFKEKGQSEIKLPGKNYEDFVNFLSCIYPDRYESVTIKTVYTLLPLAVEYQVNVLQQRCQTFLIETVKEKHLSHATEIYKHIQLAELYKLDKLRSKCIAIASEFSLHKSKKAEKSYPISDKALVEIKDIAIKRYELDRTDDKHLLLDEEDYKRVIKEEIRTGFNTLRSLRLCLRYFKDETGITARIVRKLKDEKEEDRKNAHGKILTLPDEEEEIDLLPETIKQNIR